MSFPQITAETLRDKIIDAHSHAGVNLKMYVRGEYPYAESVESLYYKQLSSGVDLNIVFPFSGDLFFDPQYLRTGVRKAATQPLSPSPYESENILLLKEIFHYRPELASRFLPFVCIDPARHVEQQLRALETLLRKYPIYGIKVNPVGCQSTAISLLDEGKDLMEFTQENNLPMTFHATTIPGEEYSPASDIFQIAEAYPTMRFCLAHSLIFDAASLQQASKYPNVWVDTAATKIVVDLARSLIGTSLRKDDLIEADYHDFKDVMRVLGRDFTDTLIWGTDSPAYSYICKRKQAENLFEEFSLRGTYEQEVEALNCLPEDIRMTICNKNTIEFLFGPV